ncbi:MAG TPA: hypothetical protein PLU22_07255 [Polyangiaceae bacterium]|nr:hypothetical protein [Polyangiaceae bacterium]
MMPSEAPGVARLEVDLEGLFCALVLVPTSFSRNRFFGLFEQPAARRVRRRAARVRGVVRQLAGQSRVHAEVLGQQVLADGRVILRYRIEELSFVRTMALSSLEAAALRVALERAGAGAAEAADRQAVTDALRRLCRDIDFEPPR